jgi:hypothetical protein
MLVGIFLSSSSNSSPSRRLLPSLLFPEDSRVFRSLCRLYKKTAPSAIRTRAMKPVVAPAIAAVRRETVSDDGEVTSVVGRDEVMLLEEPPMTVTVFAFDEIVGKTEFEVDSRSDAWVDTGVAELLEEIEVIEVIEVGEDDVNISEDVGVAKVDGDDDVDGSNDVVLVFVVEKRKI